MLRLCWKKDVIGSSAMAARSPTSPTARPGRLASWTRGLLAAASAGLLACGAARAEPTAGVATHGSGTIDLVVDSWEQALYQTPSGKQECPDGFQYLQMDQYNAEYPTPEARAEHERKFGYYTNRGPHGENAFYFPTLVKDPLPFRAVGGPTAIGLNLDGDLDGKGTAISLPHEKFTSPDGERGIDNQLYRVIGCTGGFRMGGGIQGPAHFSLRQATSARILMEITGVTDERNSPDVTVTFYRGADPVAVDSHDKVIPWLSQRIDYRMGRRYIQRIKGRIVDGVLTTEPAALLRLPGFEHGGALVDRDFIKGRLRLKLTADGAEGLIGGYLDVEHWYMDFAKTWGGYKIADIEGWSGPATYQALHKYADYRDPVTGQATAISAAYQVSFARAFIIHTPQSDAVVAEALSGSKRPAAGAVASR
jgi:hypothetical protein